MSHEAFREKVAIITGGSSGIGRGVARQLAGQGASLVLAARNQKDLEDAADECRQAGVNVLAVATDVTSQSQCKTLIDRAVQEFGQIDVMINNAGLTTRSKFNDVDLDLFEELMRVNYLGSVYCTHFALPYLKKTKGRVVAVSSECGKWGVPGSSAYAASKHAMTGFFNSLHAELAADGVSVTIVYPGFVATKDRSAKSGILSNIMSVEQCAQIIVRAMTRRKREQVTTLQGRMGMWLNMISPRMIDKIVGNAMSSVPPVKQVS